MDTRVIIGEWGLYYGQVFIHDKWENVTFGCFTVWGAKYELKKWKHHQTWCDKVVCIFEE